MTKRDPGKDAPRCGVGWLVLAGMISTGAGLLLILQPCPYVYMGALEKGSRTPCVIADNDTPVVGMLILFMGAFILALAYRIKKT